LDLRLGLYLSWHNRLIALHDC